MNRAETMKLHMITFGSKDEFLEFLGGGNFHGVILGSDGMDSYWLNADSELDYYNNSRMRYVITDTGINAANRNSMGMLFFDKFQFANKVAMLSDYDMTRFGYTMISPYYIVGKVKEIIEKEKRRQEWYSK